MTTRHTGRKLPGPVSIPGAMAPAAAAIPEQGAWCRVRDGNGWVAESTSLAGSGFYARAVIPITNQSGGFEQPDSHSITLPDGVYVVHWAFQWSFRYTAEPSYVGRGWAVWLGGVVCPPLAARFTDSVESTQLQKEPQLDPIEVTASIAGPPTWEAKGQYWFTRKDIVVSSSPRNRLQLGVLGFQNWFPEAVDFAQEFFPSLGAATNSSGTHQVKIVGIKDEDVPSLLTGSL